MGTFLAVECEARMPEVCDEFSEVCGAWGMREMKNVGETPALLDDSWGHSPLANIKRKSLGERTEMGDLVNPLASLVRLWSALLATAAEIWRASSKSPAR